MKCAPARSSADPDSLTRTANRSSRLQPRSKETSASRASARFWGIRHEGWGRRGGRCAYYYNGGRNDPPAGDCAPARSNSAGLRNVGSPQPSHPPHLPDVIEPVPPSGRTSACFSVPALGSTWSPSRSPSVERRRISVSRSSPSRTLAGALPNSNPYTTGCARVLLNSVLASTMHGGGTGGSCAYTGSPLPLP